MHIAYGLFASQFIQMFASQMQDILIISISKSAAICDIVIAVHIKFQLTRYHTMFELHLSEWRHVYWNHNWFQLSLHFKIYWRQLQNKYVSFLGSWIYDHSTFTWRMYNTRPSRNKVQENPKYIFSYAGSIRRDQFLVTWLCETKINDFPFISPKNI